MSFDDGADSPSGAGTVLIPDAVRSFYRSLNRHILSRNVYQLHQLYETDFPKLSDRYYSDASWPTPDQMIEDFNSSINDPGQHQTDKSVVSVLYKDLYFRHIYQRLTPDVDDRLDAYGCYIDILTALLEINNEAMLDKNSNTNNVSVSVFELPLNWLWEIVEQLIVCFQEFHAYRHRVHKLSADEKEELTNNRDMWNETTLLSYLYALVKKANISVDENDPAQPQGPIAPFFLTMGNFALIGLSRLHTLLADYTTALSVLSSFDLRAHRPLLQAVPSCFTSLYYHLAFSYFMLRRYTDSCKTLNFFLLNKNRRESKFANKAGANSGVSESITHTIESMQALFAMTHVLSGEHVDEGALNEVKEKLGDKFSRLQKFELTLFEELFFNSSPKFLVTRMPDYDALDSNGNTSTSESGSGYQSPAEVKQQQWQFISSDLQQRSQLPALLSYLSLFSSVSLTKLSQHLSVSEDEILAMFAGLRGRCLQYRWFGGSPESGRLIDTLDMTLTLDGERIIVKQEPSVRKHGEFFIRQIAKLREVQKELAALNVAR